MKTYTTWLNKAEKSYNDTSKNWETLKEATIEDDSSLDLDSEQEDNLLTEIIGGVVDCLLCALMAIATKPSNEQG